MWWWCVGTGRGSEWGSLPGPEGSQSEAGSTRSASICPKSGAPHSERRPGAHRVVRAFSKLEMTAATIPAFYDAGLELDTAGLLGRVDLEVRLQVSSCGDVERTARLPSSGGAEAHWPGQQWHDGCTATEQ